MPWTIAPARRLLPICIAIPVLAAAAYQSARVAWADHLSRSGSLSDRRQAVYWLPTAATYERLAEKREEQAEDPTPELQRAAALDPENGSRQMSLGLRAEMAGDLALAERSLLRAAALDRGYQPRYLLAQYYCRRLNEDGFWKWSGEALRTAYGDVMPLLDLWWRMRPDEDWLARQGITQRADIARQFVMLLVLHDRPGAARPLAAHLAEGAVYDDLGALLSYGNLCLSQGARDGAVEVWNRLCERRLVPYRALDPAGGPLLTNADFARTPIGTGFDWHVEQAPWIRSVRFGGGMRLALSGRQPENCLLAWQYVPAASGMRYRLHFDAHVLDAGDADGMTWVLFDRSMKVVPTERTGERSLRFIAPAEVLKLALTYQRPAGSARLEGTVAITGVSLEPEP